jgi:thiamine biosynthesis lipoprotein
MSAATSAASERFVEIEGVRYGHILDPRTGRPVDAWGSVTVVMEDPLAADAVATALFVMGPEAGLAWAREREDVGALFLMEGPDGIEVAWNDAMEPWLVRLEGSDTRLERRPER